MKKQFVITALAVLICGYKSIGQTAGQKKILFDNTHAETSGSGDWCIDSDLQNMTWNPGGHTGSGGSYYHANPQQYPTPTQTAVTSATAETYWEGALSYWGIDCVNYGYWVETLPYTGSITYGSTTNAQDLSKYDVFIVDEPNILFTTAEKTAMMNFVKDGGSLFMISDHTGSDRNNDGYDSPMIWRDFITNNSVQNNAFGFNFELENFSDANYTSNVATSTNDSITHGPFGNVTEVKWSNGTCMTMVPSQNPSVKGHTWKNAMGQTDTAVTSVTARYGCGKVAAIGDSSPPDDGTGNTAGGQISLYTGYTGDANGNHRPWLMNMTIWLAKGGTCAVTTDIEKNETSLQANVYPNPVTNELNIQLPFNANKINVSITDIMGREMIAPLNASGISLNIKDLNLAPGAYLVKISADGKNQLTKIIKQ